MSDIARLAGLLASGDSAAARELTLELEATNPPAAAAARLALETLAADPARAKIQIATLFLVARDTVRASTTAREALDLDSSSAVRTSAASILLATGHEREARDILAKVVVESPDARAAHLNLATAAFRTGDVGGAMTEYARAFDLDPLDPAPIHALMEMFAELGKWVGALAALEQSRRGEPPPEVAVALDLAAIQMLQNVAEAYPPRGVDGNADSTVSSLVTNAARRGPRSQLVAARALIDIGRFNEATPLTALLAANPALTTAERADVHYVDGMVAEHARNARAAVEHYTAAVTADATRVDAATNALSVLVALGTPEALAQVEPLLARLEPAARSSSSTLAFNEARFLQKSARTAEAIPCLLRVVELTGGDGELADLARRALRELGA